MFTGIIAHKTKIVAAHQAGGDLKLALAKPASLKLKLGDSVAVNGVCLTVDNLKRNNTAEFLLMPETLNKTIFGKNFVKLIGQEVNVELPLKYRQRMGGHFVLGHVDGVGKIVKIIKKGQTKVLVINYPQQFKKLLVNKGSVAIDGVSLTVASLAPNSFSVSLVNYTLKRTAFNKKKAGDLVNLEFDILGKYILNK
ncbi:MAG: riboflavin synthase [Candidatus Magasanikbacteria bacterium]|nr:riboflavin synthase [Candidatus Magasanikbacteria bacterium]